jgi:hypothetical protein
MQCGIEEIGRMQRWGKGGEDPKHESEGEGASCDSLTIRVEYAKMDIDVEDCF